MPKAPAKYINRDLSWLSFNARVLQEARDPDVPLIERIKFLGIFSSNLDEFFRVRVATIRRMISLSAKTEAIIGQDPNTLLNSIQTTVIKQTKIFDQLYQNILDELADHNIYLVNEKQLESEQGHFVKSYFQQEVRPTLVPIMIDQVVDSPNLKDHAIYLAIDLLKNYGAHEKSIGLIEIPTDILPRFIVLPQINHKKYIILLDDVIRYCLQDIFAVFGFKNYDAYTIKLTRDAELDIDEDISISFIEKISKSLKKRKRGMPVRFVYDANIPDTLLNTLTKILHFRKADSLIAGGRYHNFRDFVNFPNIGPPQLLYKPAPPLQNPDINPQKGVLSTTRYKDVMLHFPYQSFHYIIDFLREASIDPFVQSIHITLYRVAKNSNVVNALINAVKNGKAVTVIIELQARFDEEANIFWTKRLEEEGVKVIMGVQGLKVHSKLCLITRQEGKKINRYAYIGTGNFNEVTAKVYCDDCLLTSDKRLTTDVANIFSYFENNRHVGKYKHLVVSPFNMRKKFTRLLDTEIKNAYKGKKAYCILKLNSLSDMQMIDKLYEAGKAGVKIRLITRGICSLIPGKKGFSKNIKAISIVDKYLEHSRVFIFCHGGNEKYYISSADWMPRNLNHRAEVACPIYDKNIQKDLKRMLNIQLNDTSKARILSEKQNNRYKQNSKVTGRRAQIDIYKYLRSKIHD